MPKSVICMADTQTQAQAVVNRLSRAGIAAEEISIVMADHSGRYGHAPNSESLLSLLEGVGRIVIPGAGFFIAAGPILRAIQDTPQCIRNGVAGALIGFGLPAHDASRHLDMIKAGDILICFRTPDNDEAQRIREILDNTDVKDISTIGEEDLTDMNRYLSSRSVG